MIQHIMHNGKSGMNATKEYINNISQNMVNATTTGYKRIESEFQTLMSSSLDRDSYPNYSENVATGNGVKTSSAVRENTQGALRLTSKFTDFAIVGDGYFRVLRADGSQAYTRNGEFSIDGAGRLVDYAGNIVDIEFEQGYSYDNFSFSVELTNSFNESGIATSNGIDREGYIRQNGEVIGKINIYTIANNGSDDLRSIGDNLYIPKDGVNMVQSNTSYMRQGYIETSNVNTADEMTDLIAMQRAYQLAAKGVTTADEMWQLVNQM